MIIVVVAIYIKQRKLEEHSKEKCLLSLCMNYLFAVMGRKVIELDFALI